MLFWPPALRSEISAGQTNTLSTCWLFACLTELLLLQCKKFTLSLHFPKRKCTTKTANQRQTMLASGNEQQQQQQNKCLCAVLSTRAAVACMYVSWWCVCFRCGCNCPARGQQHIALMTTTNAKERQVFFAYHIAYMFKKAITLFFYDLQAKKVPRKTIDLTKSICCSINL